MSMKFSKHLLLTLFIFLTLQLGSSFGQEEYVIGEGDLLRVTVYDNPDLSTEARVSGDGKISFPLIGEVALNDMKVADAEKTIARLLEAGYIIKPQVNIFIAEYKSKKVTVLGEVTKPGIVVLRGASTLLEVISDAGGITLNAGDTIVITRKLIKPSPERRLIRSLAEKNDKDDNKEKDDTKVKDAANAILSTLTEKNDKNENRNNDELNVIVDTKRLFEDGDVTANVPVQAGDSVYVPKAAFVYVNGEVKTPGAYKITKGLSVLKAITIAGGFTIKASEGRTKIIRKTEKGEIRIKAKFDDLVMPDDIIQVPESFF